MERRLEQILPERRSISIQKFIAEWKKTFPLAPFDNTILDFLNALSKELLHNRTFNRVPALAALGFWLRRGNLERIRKENTHLFEDRRSVTVPAGIVFHICPSNVDTMFAYSLAVSLLAGNKNMVRMSQRTDHPNTGFIIDRMKFLMEKKEFKALKDYICLVNYGHDDELNSFFSMNADRRMIWGGDETIRHFEAFKTSAGTKDILFADRVSCALFRSSEFLKLKVTDIKELSRKFYNDSYTFDQLGCSSPQMIFFLGNEVSNKKCEKILYDHLLEISSKNYHADIYSLANLKFNFMTRDVLDDKVSRIFPANNFLIFAALSKEKPAGHSCGGGYFYIKYITQLKEIMPFVDKRMQTLSYFGLSREEISSISQLTSGKGIDRIIPVGKALEFDYTWDGYNLVEELTEKKHLP
jgi:hypothetical protein